jgi:hypothetical protein
MDIRVFRKAQQSAIRAKGFRLEDRCEVSREHRIGFKRRPLETLLSISITWLNLEELI